MSILRRRPKQEQEQEQEQGRFQLAELIERREFEPEALEAAKRADLDKSRKGLMKLSGISEDSPDYLRILRMVGDFEETLDQMIERILELEESAR